MSKMQSIKVVAEIGINHDGNRDICTKLIDGAAYAGCDLIKFQYRNLNRAYASSKEIGDEILSKEIKRCYLSPSDMIYLTNYGHGKNLEVGISFFHVDDIHDLKDNLDDFDFFKVPSPEMNNHSLIDELLNLGKKVLCSTGAHSQSDINSLINKYKGNNQFIPMHCVSNYPLEDFNSIIGYVTFLKNLWGGKVGYSSHDKDQTGCIVAAALGADFIERHITLNKESEGLDHSSSSSIEEMKLLVEQLNRVVYQRRGNCERKINQGEIINLQNLGRSYYATRNIVSGEKLQSHDFEYRTPRTGYGYKEFQSKIGKVIENTISKGDVLSGFHFTKKDKLQNNNKFDNKYLKNVSLPVRLHDIEAIRNKFKIKNLECHLSFGEVLGDKNLSLFRPDECYSIHIPDYISSTQLIDPFSKNKLIKEQSINIIENITELAKSLYEITNKKVILVGSFSVYENNKSIFYNNLKKLSETLNNEKLQLCYQILPPFAWYFGGSVKVNIFDSLEDYDYIADYSLPVCVDLSHLLMSSYFYKFDPIKAYKILEPHAVHFHISGADGADGEGESLGNLNKENIVILDEMIKSNKKSVIEIWQGHLNVYNGFTQELNTLSSLYK